MEAKLILPSASPPQRLLDSFKEAYKGEPELIVQAPGRAVLVGAHVDYNDGWVLPAAVNMYVWLAARPLPTPIMSIRALDMRQDAAFRLTDLEERKMMTGRPLPKWAEYAAGVAWSLQEMGLATPGIEIALTSDVPIGAGMSSSAAVEVAYALALATITGWEVERLQLAEACKRAENEYVGVQCGIMDQFAALFGRANHALLLDVRTRDWEALPLPEGIALVVADTGTRRALADGALNTRKVECEAALSFLKRDQPEIESLRDVAIDRLYDVYDAMPEALRKRAEHVITEINRVLAAAEALRSGDVNTLGAIMDESQISSREKYESSGPEIDAMWEASLAHPGRLGGRFLGAGGAGCLGFLVRQDEVSGFIEHTRERYVKATGKTPTFYPLKPADGARVIHKGS